MKLIIAGSQEQYKTYLNQTNQSPNDTKYVMDISQVMGCGRDVEFVLYGEYWRNPLCSNVENWQYVKYLVDRQ